MKVQENSFRLASRGEYFISQYNPAPRVGGPRYKQWVCSISLNVLHETQDNDLRFEWEAFIHSLDGGAVAMNVWDAARQLPKGKAAGFYRDNTNPTEYFRVDGGDQYQFTNQGKLVAGSTFCNVYQSAARNADMIVLSGLLPNESVFKPGDLIGIGGNLHEVQLEALSDSQGRSAIKLNNRLWKAALADEIVELTRPTGRFVLVDNEQGAATRGIVVSSASAQMIEVPYYE